MLASELIIESIIEAYVQVDADLRIRFMNANAERLLRRTRAEAIGQIFTAVVPDAARAHQWPQVVDAIQEERRAELSVFYPTQYIWHDVKVVPTGKGGAGLFMRDVTDRQWLIRREAERVYLRNVFESAPVAITIMRGPKHVIEYINAFGRQIIGGRRVEGKPIREALADVEEKELFTIIDDVYEKGTEFHARDLHVRFDRNGDGVPEDGWFDVSYQPARDFDGKVSGVLSLSIDVTDRARARTAAHDASSSPPASA
ncbi:MAG TPA: PAS domain-containing protein [Thermoanaerobaculia bacterium]|nr:PAS domain-containing protein [Thermoanaerobaculia bacterium]